MYIYLHVVQEICPTTTLVDFLSYIIILIYENKLYIIL